MSTNSTLINEAEEHLRKGRLDEALAAAQNIVRAEPSEGQPRLFLFHVLSVLGNWDRAQTQLNVLRDLDPECSMLAQVFEPVVRLEVHREAIFSGNASPLIFGEPEEWMGLLVHANQLFAKGDVEQAKKLRDQAFETAPVSAGARVSENSRETFDWIADADSRLGPLLEVFLNGNYYWIPFSRIQSFEIQKPRELRDLVWAPTQFTWSNGGAAHGFVPARYPKAATWTDATLRLGRRTEWEEPSENYFVGRGQRMFSSDLADLAIFELGRIELQVTPVTE